MFFRLSLEEVSEVGTWQSLVSDCEEVENEMATGLGVTAKRGCVRETLLRKRKGLGSRNQISQK